MTDIISVIRNKRKEAIADMEEPIIQLELKLVNMLLEYVEGIEEDKKKLMTDLAWVNMTLGKQR